MVSMMLHSISSRIQLLLGMLTSGQRYKFDGYHAFVSVNYFEGHATCFTSKATSQRTLWIPLSTSHSYLHRNILQMSSTCQLVSTCSLVISSAVWTAGIVSPCCTQDTFPFKANSSVSSRTRPLGSIPCLVWLPVRSTPYHVYLVFSLQYLLSSHHFCDDLFNVSRHVCVYHSCLPKVLPVVPSIPTLIDVVL